MARGVPEDRFGDWGIRTLNLLREGLFQTRILTQRLPGVMHALLLWGFLVLLLGTILATIDWEITRLLFDWRLLKGEFYLAYEAALDGFGLLLLIALSIATWRRYVKRPARLSHDHRFAEALTILFVLALSGFVMEAARLAVVQPAWAPWSFAGWALAQAFLALGLTEPVLRGIHLWVWLGHALLTFVFIARIPTSYFQHMVATPLNIFFAKLTRAASSGRSTTWRSRRPSASRASSSSRGSGGSTSTPAPSAAAVMTSAARSARAPCSTPSR